MSEPSRAAPPSPGSHREVFLLAWPAVINMVSITLMGAADTYFVGKLGTPQQGAVGFTSTLVWTVSCFFIGTLEIVQTYVAQSAGAGRLARAARWGSSGLHLALVFSCVPLAFAFSGEAPFRLFGIAPALVPFAGEYFRIRILGTAPFFLSRVGDAYYRGIGDTKTPMIVAGIANVLNIALDALWIPGVPSLGIPSYGVAGAGWATVVALCVHTVIYVGLARRRHARGVPAPAYRDRPALADARELLRVGGPSGLHWLLDIAAWTFFTVAVARADEAQAAANVIGITIIHVSFMPGFGFSTAGQTLVGRYLGARDIPSARRSGWSATRIAITWMSAMAVAFLFLREQLVGLFTDDPEVIRIGARLMLWAAAFQIGDGAQLALSGALRGAGDTRYVMWTALAASWLVFVPLTWWLMLVRGLGAEGGWMAVNAWVLALVVPLLLRFRGNAWTKGGPNLEPRSMPETDVA